MARRREPVRRVEISDGEPPPELLRFIPGEPGRWSAEDFSAFLRARAAWRDAHSEPLPYLPPRERIAIYRLNLSPALVEVEAMAPKRPPEWVRHAEKSASRKRPGGRLAAD